MEGKLKGVCTKYYTTYGLEVLSLTYFFLMAKTWMKENVVKLLDEIKMVYNASKSGLNDSVFTSWVSMPIVDFHLRSVIAVTFMPDCDVREMF